MNVYGGNFSGYREEKHRQLQAKLRSHSVAQKELKKAKATTIKEQQRAAQSQKNSRLKSDSMPKIGAGAFKRKASVSVGKLKLKHETTISDAAQKVAQTPVRTSKTTNIQLEQGGQPHKNLIEIRGNI